jgi:hypothetical protein
MIYYDYRPTTFTCDSYVPGHELGPAACSPPTPSPESPWLPGPRAAWPLAIYCHCSPRDGQTGPCQDVLRTSISRQDQGLHTRIAVAQGDVHCSKLPLDYSLVVLISHSQCFWKNQNRHQPLQIGICVVKVPRYSKSWWPPRLTASVHHRFNDGHGLAKLLSTVLTYASLAPKSS